MTAEQFNRKFPIGSDVVYTDDQCNEILARTKSEAWALDHGTVVVRLEGKVGGYDITRIKGI